MCGKKISVRSILVFAAAIIILLCIPVTLNWTLQWNIPYSHVIGGQDGPKIWLAFWGTYLAAIGSTFLGVVSIMQNRELSRQNDRLHKKDDIRFYRNHFNVADKYVKDVMRTHSLSILYKLNRDIEKYISSDESEDNYVDFQNLYCRTEDMRNKMYFVSNDILQFDSIDYKNKTDDSISYYKALKDWNVQEEKLVDYMMNVLQKGSNLDEKKFEDLFDKYKELFEGVHNTSHTYLKSIVKVIETKEKELEELNK